MTAGSTQRQSASAVVIGGGIHGLGTAFNLARMGLRHVRVLDAGYFQGGASGRNGTLVRGGFSSREWTRLFAYSNRRWIELSGLLGENVMFSRRGYVIVAQKPETAALLEPLPELHREYGLRSELLTPARLKSVMPALSTATVRSAVSLGDGGVAPHHAAMKGYLKACQRLGVRIDYGTPATAIETTGGRVTAVATASERIACDLAVIAAGAYSVDVGRLAGVTIPGFAQRIEAMALEPVRPVLHQAVALPDRLCYLHQTTRGEIVGGVEVDERPQVTLANDLPVLSATARVYAEMFPAFARLRILRHWAGMLHATPDWGPLLGAHPRLANLFLSAGWSYGIAGAPGATELLARLITTGTVPDEIKPFAVDRFEHGKPVAEGAIVLAPVEGQATGAMAAAK